MSRKFVANWQQKTRVPIDGFLMELLADLAHGDQQRIKNLVERGVLLAAKECPNADPDRIHRLERYLEKRDRPLRVS